MPDDPYGTRTRVTAVKGRCPRPLDEGAAGGLVVTPKIRQKSGFYLTDRRYVKGAEQPVFSITACNQKLRSIPKPLVGRFILSLQAFSPTTRKTVTVDSRTTPTDILKRKGLF